jgi:hypothetical protein
LNIFYFIKKEVFANANDRFAIQNYGSYHLGHTYNLEDFLVMESINSFNGTELMNNNKSAERFSIFYNYPILI